LTISSSVAKSGPYNGNGATTSFSYGFKIIDEAHIQVILTDVDGVETVQTITTDYTVTGVGVDGGGNVSMVVAPATGELLTLKLDVPLTQEVDLENQGAFFAETIESAFDKVTQIVVQQQEVLDRCVQVDISSGDDPAAILDSIDASVAAAAASASSASTSASTATTQASNASTSATNAATAKTNAETAETNAETAQAAAEAARDLAQGYADAADVAKIEWQGAWQTSTAYALNDAVSNGGSSYICIVAHTSGTFATDLAALKWELLAQKGTDGAGSLTSITAGTGLTGGTITTSGTIAVDVGTTASKIVQLNGSAQLPAVDGSLLTGITATDQNALGNIALLNMRLMLTTSITTGALVGGKQWELSTDEWGATSTNETYTAGTPNYYTNSTSQTQIAQGTGTAIGDMTEYGGLAAAFDSNTSQASGAGALKTGGASAGVGKTWGSAKTVTGFKTWGASDDGYYSASSPTITATLKGSNSGFSLGGGTTLGSASITDAPSANIIKLTGITSSSAYTSHWIEFSSSGTPSQWYCAEVQFFEGGTTSDMTLIPDASVTVSTAPTYMDTFVLWKDDSGSAVLGTDFTIELSRDGGTTYTAGTLTNLASYDGTYSLLRARANVSAQPSGTSMLCRIKTLNTKAQRVAAPAIYAE